MNAQLQHIRNYIQQSEALSDEERTALLNAVQEVDKELEITGFKLDLL